MINPIILKSGLAVVTFMIIATQTVHSYYVIDSFSRIAIRWLRIFQNVMFCSIVSLFILIMVFMEQHTMAFAGAVLEALLNIYYFFEDFWKSGFKNGRKTIARRQSIVRFWRQYWFKLILTIAIPGFIYLCSYYMTKI